MEREWQGRAAGNDVTGDAGKEEGMGAYRAVAGAEIRQPPAAAAAATTTT